MRTTRILAENVWYEIRTAVNNREPLFQLRPAAAIFFRVLREATGLFAFKMRGLRLEDERLSFYIRPDNGFQLPLIMQWMKQTFSVRFNVYAGRTGHIWGDRYWSRVLTGEPPEWAGAVDWRAVEAMAETRIPAAGVRARPGGVSPRTEGGAGKMGFSPKIPLHSTPPPR